MVVPSLILFLALLILSLSNPSHSQKPFTLTKGSSLSVDNKEDYLISQNQVFTAGFFNVGHNAYSLAVWFAEPLSDGSLTAVWMANRDNPVNGKHSELSLLKTGNLVLEDNGLLVWATGTSAVTVSVELKLNDTGNLFLQNSNGEILWQSFDSPTDTLLPNQNFTRFTELVSSRSLTNYSSGIYKLYYDNDNVLRLLYDGPRITSVYWPDPALRAWDAGRSTFMTERIARFNSSGYFRSTDALSFYSSDYGEGPLRRLTMDIDGNVRLYSLDGRQRRWRVSWQAISQPCTVHGICGVNSTCSYDHKHGRKCSCLPRHTMTNETDWSYGCKPEFNPTLCGNSEDVFVHLAGVQFYGFEASYLINYTFDGCRKKCLNTCNCKGFRHEYVTVNGYYRCYVKFRLFGGYNAGNSNTSFYLKLPKTDPLSNSSSLSEEIGLKCSGRSRIQLDRAYQKKQESWSLKFMLYFASAVGGLETVCIMVFFYKTRISSSGKRLQGYIQAATGFKRFSYSELQRASGNFKDEIGSGGGGIVYKGKLPDNRAVAIKYLKEASLCQGEAEFLAEVSTIGRVNHMNLIGILGYCAEKKHRLIVYEYMENGSLADNLFTGTLDWEKRHEIAIGMARGLAYLHEECLEWVLHCDVKPHNILLDADFKPKVADFGLSKLLERGGGTKFSRARGTRGYMAPEWVSNLPITSKVDVYSYGVVVLEMITGKRPIDSGDDGGMDQIKLVCWVKEKMHGGDGWIEEIVDPTMAGECDIASVENVVKVAVRCVDEDKDARPSMSQVVKMLLHPENHH